MRPMYIDGHALTVLADQGYQPESVPPAGSRVLIRRNPPYIKHGGILTDVTDRVHPEVAARAVAAARVIGLDVAGIDVVALDMKPGTTPAEAAATIKSHAIAKGETTLEAAR